MTFLRMKRDKAESAESALRHGRPDGLIAHTALSAHSALIDLPRVGVMAESQTPHSHKANQ